MPIISLNVDLARYGGAKAQKITAAGQKKDRLPFCYWRSWLRMIWLILYGSASISEISRNLFGNSSITLFLSSPTPAAIRMTLSLSACLIRHGSLSAPEVEPPSVMTNSNFVSLRGYSFNRQSIYCRASAVGVFPLEYNPIRRRCSLPSVELGSEKLFITVFARPES